MPALFSQENYIPQPRSQKHGKIRSQDQIFDLDFNFIFNLLIYFQVSDQGLIQLRWPQNPWSSCPCVPSHSGDWHPGAFTVISDVCTQHRQQSHWIKVLLTWPAWRDQCTHAQEMRLRTWYLVLCFLLFLPCGAWQAWTGASESRCSCLQALKCWECSYPHHLARHLSHRCLTSSFSNWDGQYLQTFTFK